MTDVRNNARCIWDSEEEATKVWERIKHHIPAVYMERKVLGLNERYALKSMVGSHVMHALSSNSLFYLLKSL